MGIEGFPSYMKCFLAPYFKRFTYDALFLTFAANARVENPVSASVKAAGVG